MVLLATVVVDFGAVGRWGSDLTVPSLLTRANEGLTTLLSGCAPAVGDLYLR